MSDGTPTEEILDATCGGRSIWHPENKERDDTLYIGRRREDPGFHGQEGRAYGVDPDEVQDFRDLPYPDESFNLVVWDPPHEVRPDGMGGLTGYQVKKYGALQAETWQADLREGFDECWRVLRTGGTLTLKWADETKGHDAVLGQLEPTPLYGVNTEHERADVKWWVFHKSERGDQ